MPNSSANKSERKLPLTSIGFGLGSKCRNLMFGGFFSLYGSIHVLLIIIINLHHISNTSLTFKKIFFIFYFDIFMHHNEFFCYSL